MSQNLPTPLISRIDPVCIKMLKFQRAFTLLHHPLTMNFHFQSEAMKERTSAIVLFPSFIQRKLTKNKKYLIATH